MARKASKRARKTAKTNRSRKTKKARRASAKRPRKSARAKRAPRVGSKPGSAFQLMIETINEAERLRAKNERRDVTDETG